MDAAHRDFARVDSGEALLISQSDSDDDSYDSDQVFNALNKKTTLGKQFSTVIRWAVLIILVTTASCFVVSNNSDGAWVELTVTPYHDGHYIYWNGQLRSDEALSTIEEYNTFAERFSNGLLKNNRYVQIKLEKALIKDDSEKKESKPSENEQKRQMDRHLNVDSYAFNSSEWWAAQGWDVFSDHLSSQYLSEQLDGHYSVVMPDQFTSRPKPTDYWWYPLLSEEVRKRLAILESIEEDSSSSMNRDLSSDSNSDGEKLQYNYKALDFTLVSSAKDFWQAEAYALAVLIVGFSGAWPYGKLVLLAVAWLYPMKYHRREKLLVFLDQMGKFSFIDVHVTVTMIVAFYFTLDLSYKEYTLEVGITVEPGFGLTLFMIGTMLSQLYSMIFLELDTHYIRPQILSMICTKTKVRGSGDLSAARGSYWESTGPAQQQSDPPVLATPELGSQVVRLPGTRENEQLVQRRGLQYSEPNSPNAAEEAAIVQAERDHGKAVLLSISDFLDNSFFRESLFDLMKEEDKQKKRAQKYANSANGLGPSNPPPVSSSPLTTQRMAKVLSDSNLRVDRTLSGILHRSTINLVSDQDLKMVDKRMRLDAFHTPLFRRNIPNSFGGVLLRAVVCTLVLAVLWGTVQSVDSAPVRYDLDGVVTLFMSEKDSHIITTTWDTWIKMPSRTNQKVNAWFCSVVFLITVCLMPIASCVLCVIIWFVPLPYKVSRVLNKWLLPFFSWSALDVYCVASVAASTELHMVADWIINDNYKEICGDNGIITNIFGTGCFGVEGHIVWPCYVMIVSCLLFWFCLFYTVKTYNQSQKNRESIFLLNYN